MSGAARLRGLYGVVSAFLPVIFLAWTLPLGIFITSSQEAGACGGKRAFHMCSVQFAPGQKDAPSGLSFTKAGGLDQMPKAQGSGVGDHVVLNAEALVADPAALRFFRKNTSFVPVLLIDPIEHPPQAFLFTL